VLGVAAAMALCAPSFAQQGGQIPVEDFFRSAQFRNPALSPDGKFLAMVVADGKEQVKLAVVEIGKPEAAKVVAAFEDAQIGNVYWINDKRLVFDVAPPEGSDRSMAPGLWAVDRDGEDFRQLINAEWTFGGATKLESRLLSLEWSLAKIPYDGSDEVILAKGVGTTTGQLARVELIRLNTRTTMRKTLSAGAPQHTVNWFMDPAGRLRGVLTQHEGRVAVYLRKNEDSEWTLWREGSEIEGVPLPAWFFNDEEMLVLSSHGPKQTAALFKANITTGKIDAKPLIDVEGYDLQPGLVYDPARGQLLGLHFYSDALGSVWFDPAMREAQAEVDKLLPTTVNRLDCGACSRSNTVLVTAGSDREPAAFYLYDRKTKTLSSLARRMPWIDPLQMAKRDVRSVKVRDGLEVPVLLTLPKGAGKQPMPAVMLVHGGPNVRGTHWNWDPMAQFLASRGYLVLEPEFRGSTGYGFKHFQAGWKQWGLGMQDDVTDVTKWAINQGLIDPKRICIAGASYGGYATLMGLIKTPELFQCGVDWVGVTDLDMLFTVHWSDASDNALKFGMPVVIGNRVKDKQMFIDNSPLHQAAKLKRPLLMAYGELDRRVPMVHGRAMLDALTEAGNKPEWITYADEGHGWRKVKNNVDFWTRVERFLGQHIGPGAADSKTTP